MRTVLDLQGAQRGGSLLSAGRSRLPLAACARLWAYGYCSARFAMRSWCKAMPRRLSPKPIPNSLGVIGLGIVITTVLSVPVELKVRDTSLGKADNRNNCSSCPILILKG